MSLTLHRSYELEILDQGDFTPSEYRLCLKELERINRLTGGYQPTIGALRKVALSTSERPLKILDIGFGYGDTWRTLAIWAKQNGLAVDLHGIELNPQATEIAKEATPRELNIHFHTQDVFEVSKQEKYHLIINALMFHHLDDSAAILLMRWMALHASHAWFINHLHRHPLAYWIIRFYSEIFWYGRLVRNDGPLSVLRGFKRGDWERLIVDSGLKREKCEINWWWSFRYGVFYEVT